MTIQPLLQAWCAAIRKATIEGAGQGWEDMHVCTMSRPAFWRFYKLQLLQNTHNNIIGLKKVSIILIMVIIFNSLAKMKDTRTSNWHQFGYIYYDSIQWIPMLKRLNILYKVLEVMQSLVRGGYLYGCIQFTVSSTSYSIHTMGTSTIHDWVPGFKSFTDK